MEEGAYQPLTADAEGNFVSDVLGLRLVRWTGDYSGVSATWLRWADLDGRLLPTDDEIAAVAARERDQARQRIAELETRLARLQPRDEHPNS